MKAYKFRSSSQFEFALDIILNNRLYCSDWRNLNDPMEGMFVYGSGAPGASDPKERVAQIIEQKRGLKVCSLSKTFDCHLLWAHYASGFSGIAIEVDIPERSSSIKHIQYGGVFGPYLSPEGNHSAEDAASLVLSSKYKEWAYEKEVRVLQHDEYYELPKPVVHVIAGHRMRPALFDTLRIVCESKGILVSRTGIGDEGIDADHVPLLTKRTAAARRGRTRSVKR